MKVLLLYIPVPHKGYRDFIRRHTDASRVLIFGEGLIEQFPILKKNLPAISPYEAMLCIIANGWTNVSVTMSELIDLDCLPIGTEVVMPDEDVCRELARKYLSLCKVTFESTFLRWDRTAASLAKDVIPDVTISEEDLDRCIMRRLDKESEHSPDFWRQVAAAMIKDGEIVMMARNRHLPTDYFPYMLGDPRGNFSRGIELDLTTAEHAETQIISTCACKGISTEGASLYVTTFPCPPCSMAVATAGFSRIFFRDGYTKVNAEDALRTNGVEIIRVNKKP